MADKGKIIQFPGSAEKQQSVTRVPLSSVFKDPHPPEKLTQASYEKKSYSWGELRTLLIGKGVKGSIIIHPEQWWRISNLKPAQAFSYTDESGRDVEIVRTQEDELVLYEKDKEKPLATGDWNEFIGAMK